MDKQDNFGINFSLKGFVSIQIGLYFLLASYFIKTILEGFLIDDNPFGMLSAEILEIFILVIAFFLFLFSSLALFFKGRRNAKKNQLKLFNTTTKTAFFKYLISFLVLFLILFFLMKLGYIDLITPSFLIIYALILFLFKEKESKNLLIISGICILLAVICFLIPSYWYSSLFILGVAHITYGVVVKS